MIRLLALGMKQSVFFLIPGSKGDMCCTVYAVCLYVQVSTLKWCGILTSELFVR